MLSYEFVRRNMAMLKFRSEPGIEPV